jgi:hypothetical protein
MYFSPMLYITMVSFSLFATFAHAATLEVGTGKTYTTIQSAINAAGTGDTVLVYDGTYVENINFNGKAITAKSANGPASTTIDGSHSGSVVTFNNFESSGSVLDGFIITNGSSGDGGGIYCNSSSPTITNCYITANLATNLGGGIYCGNSSWPTIDHCSIDHNNARDGGGIACENATVPIILATVKFTLTSRSLATVAGFILTMHTPPL